MAFTRRQFSGNAPASTLQGPITGVSTSCTVASGTGYPSGGTGPFTIVIDPGTGSEEKVLCSSTSGNTIDFSTRGYDGTTATSHSQNAVVQHVVAAIDLDEANQAVAATLGTVTTKGDLLVASGSGALGRLAAGTDGSALVADSTQTLGLKWGATSGGLLATPVWYNPAIFVTLSASGATYTDLDAVHLSTSFTAPASGSVMVSLEGLPSQGSAGSYSWAISLDGTTVTASQTFITSFESVSQNLQRSSLDILLTGLAAGVHTVHWQHATTGAAHSGSTGAGFAGGVGSPAVMKVIGV